MMKGLVMNYRTILLFLLIYFLYTCGFSAEIHTASKKIERTFKVSPATTVDITNKYGKIHIIHWSKDSARFEINVTARSDEKDKLKKLLDNVSFDFTGTQYYVTAKTIIGTNRSNFLDDLKQIRESIVSSESGVKIDYTVMLPNYVNLKIDNRYGDVYADDIKGSFNLNLTNGDFNINSISGDTKMDVKFGNGDINTINNGHLTIAYGELEIKKAEQLDINSKSSKINIGKIHVLKIQSRRDKYYIDNIDFLYGETYFSDVWPYLLNKEISFNMKYGNLNMKSINKTFSFININSQFTDLNLYFQKGSSYEIDITHKNNMLNFPEEISNLQKQALESDSKQFLTHGTIGKSKPTAKVRIKGEGSNIYIKLIE